MSKFRVASFSRFRYGGFGSISTMSSSDQVLGTKMLPRCCLGHGQSRKNLQYAVTMSSFVLIPTCTATCLVSPLHEVAR